MRKPTPVTTPSMMRVRWSTAKAKSTWKPETAIQGRPLVVIVNQPSGIMVAQTHATMRAGTAVKSRAMVATRARGSLRPRVPLIRKPAKGRIGMSQSS